MACDDDCCWKCNKWFLVAVLVPYFLIVPAVLLYIGFSYDYCDDIFSTWLIVGGFLLYLDVLLGGVSFFVNRTFHLKKLTFPCIGYTFIIVTVSVLIWWVFGFSRIFGPARRPNLDDMGMVELSMYDDPICWAALYTFPFWLVLTPFMLVGWFFIFILFFACCSLCCTEEYSLEEMGLTRAQTNHIPVEQPTNVPPKTRRREREREANYVKSINLQAFKDYDSKDYRVRELFPYETTL